MPVNYQDTKIYKLIYDGDLDQVLSVGHTAEKYLSNRMSGHRCAFRSWKKGKHNKLSYFTEDLDITKVDIVLIELYPCNNVAEARGRELFWINEYKTKQTKPQPITVKGCSTNAKEWFKEYKQLNKEELKERDKQYRIEHKEELKEKAKQYRAEHIEELKERSKQYRVEHTEEIKAKKSAKKPCELCGKEITSNHLARHKRENCPNRNKTDSISIDD